jgi:3-methylcrotonyl-CoA carboxylase beta subunit
MGGEQAAQVLTRIKQNGAKGETANDQEEWKRAQEIREQYATQGHPYYATARLWDDGIIAPSATRDVLGRCLGIAAHAPASPTRFGVFRM